MLRSLSLGRKVIHETAEQDFPKADFKKGEELKGLITKDRKKEKKLM